MKDYSSSCFLFGPRMTGKTHLLSQCKSAVFYDLLDPQLEKDFITHPQMFWEEISALKTGSQVIIDEIQKVPSILDYVQMGIDQKNLQFFLSGSSARKLKRGKSNLLGGRALDLKLHPLTIKELGKDFNIHNVLLFGSLPLISSLVAQKQNKRVVRQLKSYVTTYIKEEIKAESLVRNLSSFYRFLDVAAQCNGQMIEFSNISRECSVHMNTVKEHYSILEDTLMGRFIWPFDRSERKKARPKFYFFDCGIVRALQNRLTDKPATEELGFLFETWVANELIRVRDYMEYAHQISCWRKDKWEIDFLIHSGKKPIMAIECKSGKQIKNKHSIKAFQREFPKTPVIICSLYEKRSRKIGEHVWVEPYVKTIEKYRRILK
ncbi:MAG: AAA family ATPase [Bdellovibrionales bacterium]|nr:AAA family ATPase [Bdellovibrionales bacterium]